jgi:hypothetical protein
MGKNPTKLLERVLQILRIGQAANGQVAISGSRVAPAKVVNAALTSLGCMMV